jgi:cytochrome c oxidase cbb3-type subunit 4
MDYNSMRIFADSYGLLFLFLVFLFVLFWVFRPGSGKMADDAARIPLNEDR